MILIRLKTINKSDNSYILRINLTSLGFHFTNSERDVKGGPLSLVFGFYFYGGPFFVKFLFTLLKDSSRLFLTRPSIKSSKND